MTQPITTMEVQRLLNGIASRAGTAAGAVLLSNDGLVVASSNGVGQENAEHLSALVAGVQGLARGACRRFAGGDLMQSVIEMDSLLVFMVPAGDQACLAMLCAPDADAGAVVYEMTDLAERFAARPPLIPRLSGRT